MSRVGIGESLVWRYVGRHSSTWGSAQDDSQISPRTRELIDSEVQRIVTEQYDKAQSLLRRHRGALETLAAELLLHETLDGSAVGAALAGEAGESSVSSDE